MPTRIPDEFTEEEIAAVEAAHAADLARLRGTLAATAPEVPPAPPKVAPAPATGGKSADESKGH